MAVNVWYHVGSKNERPGRTGFAHLFEHLMFEGSQHYDKGYFHPLQEAGALLNGSTNADRTNYWEVVPSNALELALWMESDRMGYLLPALTDAKFENQRDVVLNERRQKYENRPYGLAGMAIVAALYPPDHPVSLADDRRRRGHRARRASTTCARSSRPTTGPRNASLSIAGDVAAGRGAAPGRGLLRRARGRRRSRRPSRARLPAARTSESRLVLEDRVELPRLYLAWHSPALFAAGDAELDLVAEVLASGKTSRLYRTLVFEQRLATEVAASQNSREIGELLPDRRDGGARAARSPSSSAPSPRRSIAFIQDGPTAVEMERCRAQAEAQFVYRLQTVGGFGGKGDQLNAYNVFLGEPDYFDRDLARYREASAAALQRAAAEYLRPETRVVLSVVPKGRTALALADAQPAVVA